MLNFKKLKPEKNIIIILICVTIILSPIFLHGAILGHDSLTHMFRIVSLSQNISNGDLFAKIGYNYINGYGYGTGIFYPQLNLYFPSLIYLLTKNVSIAIKLFIYFNTSISGLLMYYFLKRNLRKNSALIGALLYILSPYCYIQSMFRGAIGEMSIFVSLPLIFLGIEKIKNNEDYGNLCVILGGIYILQSHIISSIYLILFILLYFLLNFKKIIKKNTLFNLFKCLIIIFLLSTYFLVPFFEHYLIGGYNILNGKNNPSSSIVYLSQLFFHSGFNFGNIDGYEISEEMSYSIGLLIVCFNICLPYVYNNLKDNKKLKPAINFLVLGLIAIFMMCCPYIWGHFKILDIIQFPWRLLSFVVFFLSISGAYIFNEFIINKKKFPLFLSLFLIISFIELKPYIINTPNHEKLDFDLKKITENQIIDDNNTYLFKSLGGANDYLPVETTIDYIINREKGLIIQNEKNFDVKNYSISKGVLVADISVEKGAKIEFPFIYYLGYSIKIDDLKIKYHKNKNGFVETSISKDLSGKLTVKYTGTNLEIICRYISLITLIIYIVFYLVKIFRQKILKNYN